MINKKYNSQTHRQKEIKKQYSIKYKTIVCKIISLRSLLKETTPDLISYVSVSHLKTLLGSKKAVLLSVVLKLM
jgi:hypothetical protein